MSILSLFNTCGYIVGPAMWIAGLIALGICLRASLQPRPAPTRRTALAVSLTPLGVGICGALFGLAMVWWAGRLPVMARENWLALGKVCLAGLVVTAPPLAWALVLGEIARRGRHASQNAAG